MLVLLSLAHALACTMYAVPDADTGTTVWMGANLSWSLTSGSPEGIAIPGHREVLRVSFVASSPKTSCAPQVAVVDVGMAFYGTDHAGTNWEADGLPAEFWNVALTSVWGWTSPVDLLMVGEDWSLKYRGFYTEDASNRIVIAETSLLKPFVWRVVTDTIGASAVDDDEIQACLETVTFTDGVNTVRKAMPSGPVCGGVLRF